MIGKLFYKLQEASFKTGRERATSIRALQKQIRAFFKTWGIAPSQLGFSTAITAGIWMQVFIAHKRNPAKSYQGDFPNNAVLLATSFKQQHNLGPMFKIWGKSIALTYDVWEAFLKKAKRGPGMAKKPKVKKRLTRRQKIMRGGPLA